MSPGPPPQWDLLAVIPAVNIREAFEGGNLVAIGGSDPRHSLMQSSHPNASLFLSRFQTPFGDPVVSTIVVSPSGGAALEMRDVARFRDLVAIVHLLKSRGYLGDRVQIRMTQFAELFDIYPLTLTTDKANLYLLGAEWGIHSVDAFKAGHPSGALFPQHLSTEADSELKTGLLKLWAWQPNEPQDQQFRRQIFRSINVDCNAMRSTSTRVRDDMDVAVPLSLWVTAFEVLANPQTRDVFFSDVSALIKSVPRLDPELSNVEYEAISVDGKTTLPVQIYGRLYRLRNWVLHGTALPENQPEPEHKEEWGDLQIQVPALYRCVLLALLATKKLANYRTLYQFQSEHINAVMETSVYERAIRASLPAQR